MESLRDFWARAQSSGWLPSPDDPLAVLYFGIGLGFVAVVLWLMSRILFGPSSRGGPKGPQQKQLKRDLRELIRQGNHQEAGRIYESLGQPKKAIAQYVKGGCHGPLASLLIELGQRARAKEVAREGGQWRIYAELSEDDGEHGESALAYERDGQMYLAARAYDRAQEPLRAARCYLAAGMEAESVKRLRGAEGREAAELMERAIRASIEQTGSANLSLDMTAAVRRGAQLWLTEREPERAFSLAVDAGQMAVAVPIAKDFLEPTAEAAEICVKAGAHLAAAEIFERSGDARRAALERAEHYQREGNAGKAAEWLESAEEWSAAAGEWATAGDTQRAAGLYEKAGDLTAAAELYGVLGDRPKQQTLLQQARSNSVEGRFEADATLPQPDTVRLFKSVDSLPADTLPVGAQLDGRYRILGELGRGGMGVVYRAEDRMLQREVAYKVVPEQAMGGQVTAEALLTEARSAARLSHPNIVQVYDVGRSGEDFFVVMELIQGQSFDHLLLKKQMSIRGVIHVARQISSALEHAHGRRIVHRDLKPSNLMWSDEQKRVKLTDFGLARIFEDNVGKVATQPAGTPSYMAPEQIRGEPVGPEADIYAFGCVLFELLCRRSVFGSGGATSFYHHLHTAPQDPRSFRKDVPDDLADIVLACLAKDPEQRPASAADLSKRLAALS
ncbi:MAG: protein kinase [Acidobacteriota bacterium]